MTMIAAQTNSQDTFVGFRGGGNDLPGCVTRSIVNQHDLVSQAEPVANVLNSPQKLR